MSMTMPASPRWCTEADYLRRRDRLSTASHLNRPRGHHLGKATSNLFRTRVAGHGSGLDVREFNHVIDVNPQEGWIEAEGMTTYEDLLAAALARGVMPTVVPELKTITVGGAAAGVGIEATSFRYGLVHESLLELDILTAGGNVYHCTPDNAYRDLFFGFANSYGTLGYALKVKVGAAPVKPYVAVEHRRVYDLNDYFRALEEACQGDADFIDGVAFDETELYLNIGRFVSETPYVSDYTFEHIYYRSIREREADYLSVQDFLWRWDTDWFWCSKRLGAQVGWIRRLYGRKRLGSRTYQRIMRWNDRWKMTATLDRVRGGYTESVIQDVDIPVENAAAFLRYFQREIGISPVWICPLTSREHVFPLYPMPPGRRFVNFGFWDVVRRRYPFAAYNFNKMIEAKVFELGGTKSLYSDSFFSRAEFDHRYGGDAYRALKAKYDPQSEFGDRFDKCVRATE